MMVRGTWLSHMASHGSVSPSVTGHKYLALVEELGGWHELGHSESHIWAQWSSVCGRNFSL
jgi:hypothetical protein